MAASVATILDTYLEKIRARPKKSKKKKKITLLIKYQRVTLYQIGLLTRGWAGGYRWQVSLSNNSLP